MPDSRSAPLKAAWERARKYAAEHNVSVRKARSILAKQEKPPKVKSTKKKAGDATKPPLPRSDELIAAEKQLRAKYPHIVPGTLAVHTTGPHKNRRTVEIECVSDGCKSRRLVHTSDLFQVTRCRECTKLHRQRRRSKSTKKKGAT